MKIWQLVLLVSGTVALNLGFIAASAYIVMLVWERFQ